MMTKHEERAMVAKKQPREPVPPEAMAQAHAIYDLPDEETQGIVFNDAAEKFEAAHASGDAEAKEFWRLVFVGYAFLISRKGCRNMTEWHNVNTAGEYAQGYSMESD